MEEFLLKKENGHIIPCIMELPAACRKLIIVVHGYNSSKESDNAKNLFRNLLPAGYGLLAYDQPGHGSHEAAEEDTTISACMDSLACVEEYLADRLPGKEICYFGSSFGAYILGIYLAKRKHRGHKAFMRCAAVNFPELVLDDPEKHPTPEEEIEFAKCGHIALDLGLDEAAVLTREVMMELKEYDLTRIFEQDKPEDVSFAFAHGEIDSVVPVGAALDFAYRFGYPITVFPGEDHPICTDPASPVKVAQLADELYSGEDL